MPAVLVDEFAIEGNHPRPGLDRNFCPETHCRSTPTTVTVDKGARRFGGAWWAERVALLTGRFSISMGGRDPACAARNSGEQTPSRTCGARFASPHRGRRNSPIRERATRGGRYEKGSMSADCPGGGAVPGGAGVRRRQRFRPGLLAERPPGGAPVAEQRGKPPGGHRR